MLGKRFTETKRNLHFWNYPNTELIKDLGTPQSCIILDVGSWYGERSEFLKGMGHCVMAFDIDLKNFLYKSYEGVMCVAGDAHSLPFRENTFDFVVNIELLEHLSYPKEFINDSFEVLKDRGRLLCTFPSLNSPIFRKIIVEGYRKLIRYERRNDPIFGHKHIFSDRLGLSLVEGKFVVIKLRYLRVLVFLSSVFGMSEKHLNMVVQSCPSILCRLLAQGLMLLCEKRVTI